MSLIVTSFEINLGLLFPSPNGSNFSINSIKLKFISLKFNSPKISKSINSFVYFSSIKVLFRSFLNSSKFSSFRLKPIAKLCPPNFSNRFFELFTMLKMLQFVKLLPLPLYIPFSVFVKIIVGFLWTLPTLDATIPTTPSCQFSPSKTKILSLSFALFIASCVISFSISFLLELNSINFSSFSLASFKLLLTKNSNEYLASSILPALFRSGAIKNAISSEGYILFINFSIRAQ